MSVDIDERSVEQAESPQAGAHKQQPSFAPIRRKLTEIEPLSITPITQHKSLRALDTTYLNNNGGPASVRPLDKDSVKS